MARTFPAPTGRHADDETTSADALLKFVSERECWTRDILEEIGQKRAGYRWRCKPIFSRGNGLNPGRRLYTGESRRRR